MTQKYTNDQNISLPMSVWLATDNYDGYDTRENVISVTTLMKPVRQYILSRRLQAGEGLTDLSLILAARLGNAVHSAIEQAWLTNAKQGMLDLGYPTGVAKSIRINPTEPDEDYTDVYLELRTEKAIGNWIVSGACDMICDFHVHDIKSTGVGMYLKGTKDEDYSNQMSMYRWLNPDKITEDKAFIEFLFKDWSLIKSFHTTGYPQSPVIQHPIMLKSLGDTEHFITNKLNQIDSMMDADEADLPLCTDKELWRDEPTYQYFSKITNSRATKNCATQQEANAMMLSKGTGVVKVKPSKAMACLYCNVSSKCSQYADMLAKNLIASQI